jgi:hypothetical protein
LTNIPIPDAWQVTLAAENTEYVSLMHGVELVMSDPGSSDLPVSHIFTHTMFLELRCELANQVVHWLAWDFHRKFAFHRKFTRVCLRVT